MHVYMWTCTYAYVRVSQDAHRRRVPARSLLGHQVQLKGAAVQVAGDEQCILGRVVGQRLGALQARGGWEFW